MKKFTRSLLLMCAMIVSFNLIAKADVIHLNFDSVDTSRGAVDATAYLASFGIGLANVSPPGSVYIVNQNSYCCYYVFASSAPNVLNGGYPAYGLANYTYTLVFTNPLQSLSFTRCAYGYVATPSWTATAYAGSRVVDSVGVCCLNSDFEAPAHVYTLNGPGITSLTIASDGYNFAGIDSPPLDDFYLTPQSSTPNLAVTDAKIAQVVWNPDINGLGIIDLVQGKPAVVQATVTADGVDPADTRQVTVQAQIGSTVLTTNISLTAISSTGTDVRFFFTPTIESGALTVTVDPSNTIEEANTNKISAPLPIDVKPTRPLNVGFVAIDGCAPLSIGPPCYGPLEELDDTITKSGQFITATYPISSYSGTRLPGNYFGSSIQGQGGVLSDLLEVGLWTLLSGHDRGVGVVPRDYFSYHGMNNVKGVSIRCIHFPAGLVTEGYWTAAAHEVGHTFGLFCAGEEYNPATGFHGNPANGFWVSPPTGPPRVIENSICFMGDGEFHNLTDRWVDETDYDALFRQLRVNPTDPTQSLLISAMLHQDGTVDLGNWYLLDNATPTESTPGNYVVRVLDSAGQVLCEVSEPVDFIVHFESVGVQPTDITPLLLAIPYSSSASSVEIVREGQILVQVSPGTKLLRDAINSIPDYGFVTLPTERRKALLNEVGAIEKMMSTGASNGALQKLKSDFRPKIQSWLLDGYVKSNPLQLEKPEVLRVVDSLISQLGG